MATMGEACRNLRELVGGFDGMVVECLHDRSEDVVDFIQEQLYSGVNGLGKPLRPTYLQDPYFKTDEAGRWKNNAAGYVKWKKKITSPTPSYLGISPRGDTTPNLIIRGDFYSSITAIPIGDGLRVKTRGVSFGKDIEAKYGSVIFGMSPYANRYFIRYGLNGAIKAYFSKYGIG